MEGKRRRGRPSKICFEYLKQLDMADASELATDGKDDTSDSSADNATWLEGERGWSSIYVQGTTLGT